MPELPEVETITRQLVHSVVGKRIINITARWPRSLTAAPQDLDDAIGARITRVERRGKLIIISTDSDSSVLIHLRMTGQLLLGVLEKPDQHERARIVLDDTSVLRFNDPRKFGRIQVISQEAAARDPFLVALGPEATDAAAVARALRRHAPRRRSPIKALLLDQHVIAGIGNIYADEILFTAGINPATEASALSIPRLRRLANACPEILNQAIDLRGSTLRDYRDLDGTSGTYLSVARVHGRKGQTCRRCSATIAYASVAGRGTYWCPSCQRRTRSALGNPFTSIMER